MLIRLLSNTWFGIVLLTLILVYSSILSALAPVRRALELTEMQAFRHWLFAALVALLMLSMLTATLFRTRWSLLSAGSLLAHLGMLLLVSGSWAYFATKVEGDVLLQAPAVVVRAKVGDRTGIIARLPAARGATWARTIPMLGETITLQVLDTQADGMQPVATARVSAQLGDGPPRVLVLGGAPNVWQPLNDLLDVGLETFTVQTAFYDNDRPVFYVRDLATGTEVAREIAHLPIYHDRYPPEAGLLHTASGAEVPSQRTRPELCLFGLRIPTGWFDGWRLPIDVNSDGLPFTIQVTGYVPFVAELQPQRLPDGRVVAEPLLEERELRQADILPRSRSAIRVKLTGRGEHAGWTDTQWCLFSVYPDTEFSPLHVQVPGSNAVWELVYSRARHALGAALAAQQLSVKYFPGRRDVESYRSDILVQTGGDGPQPVTVSTNQTYTVGHWTLYQAGFDSEEYWAWTRLGVGNRIGMWPMNIGWIVLSLGCLFAFYVKPAILRRVKGPGAALLAVAVMLVLPGCGRDAPPYQASQRAAQMDPRIDWSEASLLVVQDAGRYKTLDSFARESLKAMTGSEHFPGLSPLASLLEWVFNRDAYADTPLIRVKETSLRAQLTAHLPEDKRQRILMSGHFTPRELLDPSVERVLRELATKRLTRRAAVRVLIARMNVEYLEDQLKIVPQPGGDASAAWFTPQEVLANLSAEQLAEMGITRADLPLEFQHPVPAITPEQALAVTVAWTSMRGAWLKGDAAGVQTYLGRLCAWQPTLAGSPQATRRGEPGVYPARGQRQAEVRYYAMGKFTAGWLLYFVAFLVSIWALVTRWRFPWGLAMVLMLAGLAWHGYGVGLRWYILGRIPVANVFEAVVGAAWLSIALVVLVIEPFLKTRILLVAASATGFLALVAAGFVLPGGDLASIPGILDHIQLRIHTVLISFSYVLIFLAAVVALIYLIGYYSALWRRPAAAGTRTEVSRQRPLLARASPGDDVRGADLPQWLNDVDWSHLIILNLVFVMLFVGGVVMGAIWANESWGRPWGWDPKEVFALNTWIIYAILIHVRFVARNRGLWTAWLSLAGCAMMAFNWFFVNFFIESIHSYA